jgi:DeoR/GlpR family transcriptional regulator of sugar metabolism
MKKYEGRKNKILEALQVNKKMNVSEASELIGISPATTRRFFAQLADDGYAVRIHGGIQIVPEVQGTYSYVLSNTSRVHEKAKISGHAVELVNSGDLLFLDSGTTILKLAEALVTRLESGELTDLVIITNSLLNYEKLAKYGKVILIGGEVRLSRRDTCGQLAENALRALHMHKSFFGADAVHPDKGLMTTDEWTHRMNDIVGKNSEKVFVLVDSEKFGKSSLMTYCALDGVDLIITDDGLSEDEVMSYRAKGAHVEVVPMAGLS